MNCWENEGRTAYKQGGNVVTANPYYPNSNKHEAFEKGWKDVEFEDALGKCPWKSRVICLVTKELCSRKDCAIWFILEGKG